MSRKILLRGSVVAHVLVSDHRFEWLDQWAWWRVGYGYVARVVTQERVRTTIFMHRLILGLPDPRGDDPRVGEHENRNKLDCRDENLRIAERGELDNQQNVGLRSTNTSGYRGVSSRANGKYVAMGGLAGEKIYLGISDVALDAGRLAEAFRRQHMPFAVPDPSLDPLPKCACQICRANNRTQIAA